MPDRSVPLGEPRQGRARSMHEVLPQISVSALADAEEFWPASCRRLAWYEPEPSRHVAPLCKGACIADRSHQGSRVDRTYAWHGGEPACCLVRPRQRDEF